MGVNVFRHLLVNRSGYVTDWNMLGNIYPP